MLANVDDTLVETLAADLGMEVPAPLPKATKRPVEPEVAVSPALSLFARPGDGSIRTRRIAILVANGIDGEGAEALHGALTRLGAVPRYVGPRLGTIETESGGTIEVEATFETMPSVLFDAVAVPDGKAASKLLANVGQAVEFLQGQYRHAKPILGLGAGADLIENAGIPARLPSGKPDPGLIGGRDAKVKKVLADFVTAIARHRHHEREMDPPAV
jgi:catalase